MIIIKILILIAACGIIISSLFHTCPIAKQPQRAFPDVPEHIIINNHYLITPDDYQSNISTNGTFELLRVWGDIKFRGVPDEELDIILPNQYEDAFKEGGER